MSDLPTTRGVFEVDHAWLVPPRSVAAISERVCALLDAPPKPDALDARLRLSLQAKFDWAAVARRYAQLLSHMASPEPSKK